VRQSCISMKLVSVVVLILFYLCASSYQEILEDVFCQPNNETLFIQPLRSRDRGSTDLGWLKSRHSFSFGRYFSPQYQNFESIRVINEDYVKEGEGFPEHPHKNYEIFSYIISGTIIHKDSMKNSEECSRGDIQFTSAGKGINHSEYAKRNAGELHFLQIWVTPNEFDIAPSYDRAHFTDEQKLNKFCPIILPVDTIHKNYNQAIKIHQDIQIFATILEKDQQLEHVIRKDRKGYIHVIEDEGASLLVQNQYGHHIELFSGDALFLPNDQIISISSQSKNCEFLFFDISVNLK